jgi:hypothetical protein
LLKEFKRVLKPNGKLFITSYDKYFILHRILNDLTHVIEWSQEEFENLISREFKIIKSFKYGSFFNYRIINWLLVKLLQPELCIYAEKTRPLLVEITTIYSLNSLITRVIIATIFIIIFWKKLGWYDFFKKYSIDLVD